MFTTERKPAVLGWPESLPPSRGRGRRDAKPPRSCTDRSALERLSVRLPPRRGCRVVAPYLQMLHVKVSEVHRPAAVPRRGDGGLGKALAKAPPAAAAGKGRRRRLVGAVVSSGVQLSVVRSTSRRLSVCSRVSPGQSPRRRCVVSHVLVVTLSVGPALFRRRIWFARGSKGQRLSGLPCARRCGGEHRCWAHFDQR